MDTTYDDGTNEIPMNKNNVNGTNDTIININNVAAEVHVGTKLNQTGTRKKLTLIFIFFFLIIIFVGVCLGVYFAVKASVEKK